MRKAKFAGIFYEKAVSLLDNQITDCFNGAKGPGALPLSSSTKNISAVIAPHAGYIYSGQAAAWSYKELAENGLSDLYIIIGPNHSSYESGLTTETFEMPYGFIRVDQHFARELVLKGTIKENKEIHEDEHCIEVQIPFLQFIFKKQLEKLKILPILIGQDMSLDELKKLAIDIKEVAMDMNKKITFIISSDFTHYGSKYSYVPFSGNRQENIYKLDEKLFDFIKNFQFEEFITFVKQEMVTVCGALPIYLLLNYLKSGNVRLEQYYTSADLEENSDYKNSVSYASIIFNNLL